MTTKVARAVEPIALYVHFPWCVAKCPYCDFNSHPLKGTLEEADYLQALLLDLQTSLAWLDEQCENTRIISSVFFGGGTPSLFQPKRFAALIDALSPRLADNAEITMEANPGTTEYSDFGGYRSAGINRLSLGAQSFDDDMLKRLGRVHNSAQTVIAFDKARAAGFERINLDIMYALPEQSAEGAARDLATALDLQPDHLSWYQLTLEPRTEFYRRPPLLPVESVTTAIEHHGLGLLQHAGFERYEVSAFARTGQRSQHNLAYWTFGDYLGIGAGAHGKIRTSADSLRTAKPSQPRLYLKDPLTSTRTAIDPTALPVEFAMNALRLVDGVDVDCYSRQTGRPRSELEPGWRRLADLDLMQTGRFAATSRGYAVLDSLVAQFLE